MASGGHSSTPDSLLLVFTPKCGYDLVRGSSIKGRVGPTPAREQASMSKPSIKEFLENRSLLAIKLSSADLTGLFQKKFTVPANTVGLVSFLDGPQARV